MQRTSKRANTKGYQSPKAKKAGKATRAKINVTDFKAVTESLFIPSEMNSILAAVGGEVTIRLGPGSQSVQVTRNGAIIMTEPEVRELSQINNFVKKERKADVSIRKAGVLEELAYRLIVAARNENKDWKPVMIGPNQLTALKERDTQLSNLDHNLGLIDGSKVPASKDAKEYLLGVGDRLRNAIAESALSIIDEHKSKDIYECAFTRQVPRWAVARLANTKLAGVDPSTDLTKIIFPSDFSKGISVTVQEIRDELFVATNAYIFQRSALLHSCMKSDTFIRALVGFTETVDLKDTTSSEVLRVMKSVVTLAPVDNDLKRLAKSLEGRGTTMKWASKGRLGDHKSLILAFSHSLIKAFFGLVKSPEKFNSWWKILFPGEFDTLIRKDFTGVNNSVGNWLGADNRVKPEAWTQLYTGYSKVTRDYLLEAIKVDLQEFTEGLVYKTLVSILGKTSDVQTAGNTATVGLGNSMIVPKSEAVEPTKAAKAMSRSMNETDAARFPMVRAKFFSVKEGEELKPIGGRSATKRRGRNDPTMSARGTVPKEIQDIVREMDNAMSKSTIDASINWLRAFSIPEVKVAAANLLVARFDAYADEDEIDVEHNAEFYAESDNDDSDDEAAPTNETAPSTSKTD